MKTIGLLGGTSWVSTREYYTQLNLGAFERLGGSHSCKLLLHSFDLYEVSTPLMAGEIAPVIRDFAQAARGLETSGADCLLICANSFHIALEAVRAAVNVPVISIVEAVGKELSQLGVRTAGLLGTFATMDGDFYPERFSKLGIELITPQGESKAEIHRTIAEELTRDLFLDSTRATYVDVIESLRARGAEAVIMGCTEIPLLLSQEMVGVQLVDTLRCHVAEALKFAFGE